MYIFSKNLSQIISRVESTITAKNISKRKFQAADAENQYCQALDSN